MSKPTLSEFLTGAQARSEKMQEEAMGDVAEEVRCLRYVYVDEQTTLAAFLQAYRAMAHARADIEVLLKMAKTASETRKDSPQGANLYMSLEALVPEEK